MEASHSAPICVGVMRADSFGDDAGKIHRAALAHVYLMRSNIKKRAVIGASVDLLLVQKSLRCDLLLVHVCFLVNLVKSLLNNCCCLMTMSRRELRHSSF